jgi:hypothetical protein
MIVRPQAAQLGTTCVLALVFSLLLPCAAWAEGAVRMLDCTTVRICDSAGICEPHSEQTRFRMEPLSLDADGAGAYKLSYGDIQVEMQALTPAGPFFWINDQERNTLVASSETAFLWHRLALDAQPDADVRFLTCTLSQ